MDVRSQIAAIANAAYPREACGFVLKDDNVVVCANVADDPVNTFRMDTAEVAEWWGTEQVAAVWHSHPNDPAVPSPQDEEHARESWLAGPYLVYSVTEEDLGWYRWDADRDRLLLAAMESPTDADRVS